jgi:hypothetical protein
MDAHNGRRYRSPDGNATTRGTLRDRVSGCQIGAAEPALSIWDTLGYCA